MAESPSHKFGQFIGNMIEELIYPTLKNFCDSRGFFLDIQGERQGVRSGKKVTWEDKYGNTHDLDFVIEKGGSETQRGRPVAFIESAWRRYTKHSRNKVQEIQGAVLPVAEKYSWDNPFLGAVLAGIFTDGSLNQLNSVGFKVVYLPYDTIIEAFKSVGINARFDEATSDREFKKCVKQIKAISHKVRDDIKSHLLNSNKKSFDFFFESLRRKLDRLVDKIILTPLFGDENMFFSMSELKTFLDCFDEELGNGNDFKKYDMRVEFSNGDKINAEFQSKERVFDFLKYVAQ